MVQMTHHAEHRIRERIGVNKKATQRQADLAYEKGLKKDEVSGKLRKWIEGKIDSHISENGLENDIRIYNSSLFVYESDDIDRLITAIHLPTGLLKTAHKMTRKKTGKEDPYALEKRTTSDRIRLQSVGYTQPRLCDSESVATQGLCEVRFIRRDWV